MLFGFFIVPSLQCILLFIKAELSSFKFEVAHIPLVSLLHYLDFLFVYIYSILQACSEYLSCIHILLFSLLVYVDTYSLITLHPIK